MKLVYHDPIFEIVNQFETSTRVCIIKTVTDTQTPTNSEGCKNSNNKALRQKKSHLE